LRNSTVIFALSIMFPNFRAGKLTRFVNFFKQSCIIFLKKAEPSFRPLAKLQTRMRLHKISIQHMLHHVMNEYEQVNCAKKTQRSKKKRRETK
jgi:hypothetical protein